MKDELGRNIDYMRISITDRCNLRCRYCMPEGIKKLPMEEILTFEEILTICRTAVSLGICHIKITGGEPLVRKGCPQLIRQIQGIPGIQSVTLTTNGILLASQLEELLEAGVTAVNVSLDTLNPERFRQMTGTDGLEQVLLGLQKGVEAGLKMKVNAVSLEENLFSQGGWQALLSLAQRLPADVRFIEMMPIGWGRNFETVDHRRLLSLIRETYPDLKPDHKRHGNGPAVYYQIPGFLGSIGFISAIHGKFCPFCNRVRLTASGFLKGCLCYEDGADLRKILRGDEPEMLRAVMEEIIAKKPKAHCFEDPGQMTEAHGMSSIGG